MAEEEKRTRRGRGEHSIYWFEARGCYVGNVSLGTDGHRRRRKVVYGKTKREVQQKLALLAIAGGGRVASSSRTQIGAYLDVWLREHVEKKRAPTTHAYYRGVVEKHLKPRLGAITFDQFDRQRARRLVSSLESADLGATIAQRCYRVLRAALNRAVREDLILENPLRAVDEPKYDRGERRSLTLQQVGKLVAEARSDPLEALYVLAVTTGMRQGELLALRWDAIDIKRGVLAVTGNLQMVGSKLIVQEPKTPRSRRRVELSKTAVAALKRRQAIVERDGHESPYVFAGVDGGLPRKYNVMRRSFRPLLERAGLPIETTFHALRHTAASILLLQGTNPKVVSELLGHADVRLTLNTYSDVLPGLQRQAADAMDSAIRRARATGKSGVRLSGRLSAPSGAAAAKKRKSPR